MSGNAESGALAVAAASQAQVSRTPPNCARCRNHNITVQLKGHKRYCKFINCECEKCRLTAERQKVMARQTAIRRAEEQDRQRIKSGLPVPSVPGRPGSPAVSQACSTAGTGPGADTSCSPAPADTVTAASATATVSKSEGRRGSVSGTSTAKGDWDAMLQLLHWCKLPPNTTPLLHIILSEVTSDAKEVYHRFIEAQEVIRRTAEELDVNSPFRRHMLSADSMSPWPSLYCPPPPTLPPVLAQPQALYHPHSLPLARYHPYLPTPFKAGLTFGYSIHDSVGIKAGMLAPPTSYYSTASDYKPTSPSSEHSDKSSYSGSVDI